MAELRGRNNEGEKAFTEFDNYKRKIENFFINNKEYLTTLSQQFYYFNSRKQLQSIFADRGNKLQKEVTALKEKIQEFKKDINNNEFLTDADKNALLNIQLEQELKNWPFLNEPIELQAEDLIPIADPTIHGLVPEEDPTIHGLVPADDDEAPTFLDLLEENPTEATELFSPLSETKLAEATSEEELHAKATDLDEEDSTFGGGLASEIFQPAQDEDRTEIVIHQLNGEEDAGEEDAGDEDTKDAATDQIHFDEVGVPLSEPPQEQSVGKVAPKRAAAEPTAPLPKRVGGPEPVVAAVSAEAEAENTPTERIPAAQEMLQGDEEETPTDSTPKPTPAPVATPPAPKPEPTTAAPAVKETSTGVLSELRNSAAKFVKRFAVFAALLGLSGHDQEKDVSGNANDRAAAASAEMTPEANPNTQSVENTQNTVTDRGIQAVEMKGGNQNHIVAKGEGITHVLERLSSKEEMIKIAFTERISLDGQSIPLKDVLVKNANALGIDVEKNSDGSIAHFTFFDAHTGQKIEEKNLSQYLYVEKEAPLPQTIDAQVDQDEQETELR